MTINSSNQQSKEVILAKVEHEAYLYTKTGLYEHLEGYFKACTEGFRVGLRPEELPLVDSLRLRASI